MWLCPQQLCVDIPGLFRCLPAPTKYGRVKIIRSVYILEMRIKNIKSFVHPVQLRYEWYQRYNSKQIEPIAVRAFVPWHSHGKWRKRSTNSANSVNDGDAQLYAILQFICFCVTLVFHIAQNTVISGVDYNTC